MVLSVGMVVGMLPGWVFGDVRLHGMFADNMVLQQGIKVPVWGGANPGEKVTVKFLSQSIETRAGADGQWRVDLSPLKAGGPFDMTVLGTNRITLKNVVVGEVWLASGQSNMAWSLGGCVNSRKEIEDATYPMIRECNMARRPLPDPAPDTSVSWTVCSPQTASDFSGVGYFFARYLQKELNVPVGIINGSWGGTSAEYFTPRNVMKAEGINRGLIDCYEQCLANQDEMMRKYKEDLATYEKVHAGGKNLHRQKDPGNKGFGLGWARADFDDSSWATTKLPGTMPDSMDGAIWYRKEITIPGEWAGKSLVLSLVAINDYDVTYLNGVQIGSTGRETPGWWVHPRNYEIPGKLVNTGRNVLAVRVFDDLGEGGFEGQDEDMFIRVKGKAEKISLAGPWREKIEVELPPIKVSRPPNLPMGPNRPGPGTLYNGMIYPLSPYAIRGAIWYQGESNAVCAGEYCRLLSTMIREWRKRWGQGDFPFGIVQLANYMSVQNDANASSNWAALRDAQLKTAQTNKNVGLAVAIDIGDPTDAHAKNKQDVGKRLALWALAKVYGQETLVYSGPIYKSMKIEGNKVRLTFDHVGGGLVAKGGGCLRGFAIAGEDKKFVWAQAKIDGESVVVWSDKVAKPVVVRYAWANNPICNLYNGAGLPASPFQATASQ